MQRRGGLRIAKHFLKKRFRHFADALIQSDLCWVHQQNNEILRKLKASKACSYWIWSGLKKLILHVMYDVI